MLMKKKKVDTIYDFFKDKASQQNRSQLFQWRNWKNKILK
jgi:hypothetical protein